MIFYDIYSDVPDDVLGQFVASQQLGRLVTSTLDGQPHIGLYPFVFLGPTIEMHLHRDDEQLADLRVNPKCAFEVGEMLGTIPSHWIHPTNAVYATAYYRTVIFECEVSISDDLSVLAAQQQRLMEHYQPGGGFQALNAEDPMYRNPLNTIVALRLTVRVRKVKWKLAQNRDRETRAKVIGHLRERGAGTDRTAADALQWTLDYESAKQGSSTTC
jgi:predicted FMN-binding regulatory protein PaiB